MKNKVKVPKEGDIIYVPSAMFISRGYDDRVGGKATISCVKVDNDFSLDHPNAIFINVKEFPLVSYNYRNLLEQQEKLKDKFGDNYAYPDPDINTPWIEEGDIVNGSVYKGASIW